MIVDRDVDILPPRATRGLLAVAGDPMSRAREAAELLDVQVQEISRRIMFVAVVGSGGLEGCQSVQPLACEEPGDRAVSDAQPLGDLAIGLALPAPLNELLADLVRDRMRATPWAGRTVLQPALTFLLVAAYPLVNRPHADALGLGDLFWPEPFPDDSVHQQGSTMRSKTDILMGVHPGLLERLVGSHLQSSG